MARIGEFFQTRLSSRAHPTKVECGWQAVHAGDEVYLQLATYGSEARLSDKQVSQTLQMDRTRAAELLRIIRETFPGL